MPPALEGDGVLEVAQLNRQFQELVWKAVIPHPLSGVPARAKP
jgi:hypothetical protein